MYYYNIFIVNLMSHSNRNIFNITDEINWPYVVKKEARGIDDADFGEVQEIVLHYILTEKGIINKEKFYLPTELVEVFDGDRLRFNISEVEANEKFKRDFPPSAEEYAIYKKKEAVTNDKSNQKYNQNKNIIISLNPSISQLKEKEEKKNIDEIKYEQEQHKNSKEPMTLQNKKTSILKENDKELKDSSEEKRIKKDTGQKEVDVESKLEAERKAQSIAQQIQDKAKMEAERKAQSIIQQAEDKAKAEAERRSKEITQQAEDKSKEIQIEKAQRRRIDRGSNIVLNQANTKNSDYEIPVVERRTIEKNSYNNINNLFNSFEIGIIIWQNYYLFCLNLTKDITRNTLKITKDFENTIQENYLN